MEGRLYWQRKDGKPDMRTTWGRKVAACPELVIYKKPVITAIKLDPRQAIIAVCVSGGIYMQAGTPPICVHTNPAENARCLVTARAVQGATWGHWAGADRSDAPT